MISIDLFFRSSLREALATKQPRFDINHSLKKTYTTKYAMHFSWFASSSSIPRNDDRGQLMPDIVVLVELMLIQLNSIAIIPLR